MVISKFNKRKEKYKDAAWHITGYRVSSLNCDYFFCSFSVGLHFRFGIRGCNIDLIEGGCGL